MEKKQQDREGQAPLGETFTLTEQGSARWVSLDEEGTTAKYETGPTALRWGFRGPPWSVEPSMNLVCRDVGIDYDRLVSGLGEGKSDMELSQELGTNERVVQNLRERFYQVEALNGNYGQD